MARGTLAPMPTREPTERTRTNDHIVSRLGMLRKSSRLTAPRRARSGVGDVRSGRRRERWYRWRSTMPSMHDVLRSPARLFRLTVLEW